MKCLLSVDLEDFRYLRLAQIGLTPQQDEANVRRGVETFLNVVSRVSIGDRARVTFFTTGQVARDYPQLLKELCNAGHEIACHGYEHENISRMSAAAFGAQLDRGLEYLRLATGESPVGFRAPSFSADIRSSELHKLLVDRGFLYDASALCEHRREPGSICDVIVKRDQPLLEFPLFVQRLPLLPPIRVIGGTYLRLLPLRTIRALLRKTEALNYLPNIYVHPVDFVPHYPAVRFGEARQVGWKEALKWLPKHCESTFGASGLSRKLETLLKDLELLGTYRAQVELRAASLLPKSDAGDMS